MEVDSLSAVLLSSLCFFNSRPLVEVDLSCPVMSIKFSFQLTTSRGGRPDGVEDEGLPFNFFNSRPLVEVDTKDFTTEWPNIIFQLTTSRGGRQTNSLPPARVKVFQLTTSRGGRQTNSLPPARVKIFQLTTSRGGRHTCSGRLQHDRTFQLTTSRGGRRMV